MNDKYIDNYSIKNKAIRLIWNISCLFLFRPFNLPIFNKYRNCILKLFGAKIGSGSIVYATSKIWAPWNLEIGCRTCIEVREQAETEPEKFNNRIYLEELNDTLKEKLSIRKQ